MWKRGLMYKNSGTCGYFQPLWTLGDFGYIWWFWLIWEILVTSGDGMSKWGVRAPEFQSDVQEPPGVNGSPASDSKLWINYLFLTKAPPDLGSNSALIWRFPVAASQVVCGSWALNGRRGGLIVDTWPSGHGPKIRKNKKSTVDGRLSRTTPSRWPAPQIPLLWVILALLLLQNLT